MPEPQPKAGPQLLSRLQDQAVAGKTVLVRVDFNVPLKNGEVLDDGRIRAALPTIETLLAQEAKVGVCSHLGRPKGVDPEFSLKPIAQRLGELSDARVWFATDCVGPTVGDALQQAQPGDVVVLENLRFHEQEKQNDADFAQQLAQPFDLFVQDAFGSLHRAHASTEAVTQQLPSCAGLLVQKEVAALSKLTRNPQHPYLAIIGGKKAQEKIGGLFGLLNHVDQFLIGGGVAYTFLLNKGLSVGKSIVAKEYIDDAKRFVETAYGQGATVILPTDVQLTTELNDHPEVSIALAEKIPDDWMGVDIGPETTRNFARRIREAKTIFWAGPLGAFEFSPFDKGTNEISKAIAESSAFTVIGGGETAAAAKANFDPDRVFVSTGGGAALEFAGGKSLPGLAVLYEQRQH